MQHLHGTRQDIDERGRFLKNPKSDDHRPTAPELAGRRRSGHHEWREQPGGIQRQPCEWHHMGVSTYTTPKNSKNERDSFTISINSSDLDSNNNFTNQLNLAWNTAGNYQLARIQTSLGSWKVSDNESSLKWFKERTKIDPADAALAGFEIKNDRADRTYPIAAIVAKGKDGGTLNGGELNIDKGNSELKIEGYLQEYRDDGKAGSGWPRMSIRWEEKTGKHEVVRGDGQPIENQFLTIHSPNIYLSPQWEETDWATGADAVGHVKASQTRSFQWAMPGMDHHLCAVVRQGKSRT